jgi:hypothetical protein
VVIGLSATVNRNVVVGDLLIPLMALATCCDHSMTPWAMR